MTAVDDRNVGPARPRPRATIRPAARSTARPPYINRELSWLEYVDRVMFEARDRRNPLIERVRFLTIFASMLDEFFQIRVAGLRQQINAGSVALLLDGRSATEQLAAVRTLVLSHVQDLIVL